MRAARRLTRGARRARRQARELQLERAYPRQENDRHLDADQPGKTPSGSGAGGGPVDAVAVNDEILRDKRSRSGFPQRAPVYEAPPDRCPTCASQVPEVHSTGRMDNEPQHPGGTLLRDVDAEPIGFGSLERELSELISSARPG